MSLYKGFSFHEYKSRQTTKLQGVELVKLNLLTHIHTSKGERIMMTWFGTRIPDLVFEPLTSHLLDIIREDLTFVANFDPRVRLVSLHVTPHWEQNSVIAIMKLDFIEYKITDDLVINLDFIG